MDGLRSIRPLSRESLRGIEPAEVGKQLPKFEWVDPRTLYVEESYQRAFAQRGTNLVRRIVAGFSWARFKPPICVRTQESGSILVVIDGQHTAIAAASHGGVPKIPVMVVDADDVEARAAAFVGHNRDRIGLTQMVIYHAELASGDPIAMMMDRACRASGATILPGAISTTKTDVAVGATMAVGTIRALAKRHGEEMTAAVLSLLVKAKRAPIKANEVAAVATILTASSFGKVDHKLRIVVESKSADQWGAIAKTAAADTGESLPAALASAWCRELGLHLSGQGKHRTAAAQTVVGRVAKISVTPAVSPMAPAILASPPPPAAAPRPLPPRDRAEGKGALYDMLAEAARNTAKMRPKEET
jgi:hypothetical protein